MLSTPVFRSLVAAGLIGAATALVMACEAAPDGTANCLTSVTAGTSPAPGVLTLTGEFYPDETVTLSYTLNGQVLSASGTPATQRTSLTLTGLPSGQLGYEIVVSCQGGQEDDGVMVFTVR